MSILGKPFGAKMAERIEQCCRGSFTLFKLPFLQVKKKDAKPKGKSNTGCQMRVCRSLEHFETRLHCSVNPRLGYGMWVFLVLAYLPCPAPPCYVDLVHCCYCLHPKKLVSAALCLLPPTTTLIFVENKFHCPRQKWTTQRP